MKTIQLPMPTVNAKTYCEIHCMTMRTSIAIYRTFVTYMCIFLSYITDEKASFLRHNLNLNWLDTIKKSRQAQKSTSRPGRPARPDRPGQANGRNFNFPGSFPHFRSSSLYCTSHSVMLPPFETSLVRLVPRGRVYGYSGPVDRSLRTPSKTAFWLHHHTFFWVFTALRLWLTIGRRLLIFEFKFLF